MNQSPGMPLKELLSRFLEEPSRVGLRELLQQNFGESKHLDFKREWPSNGSLAKHLLALANSGGGCLIVGVEENGAHELTPVGLNPVKDKAEIDQAMRSFLPEQLSNAFSILDFSFQETEYGKLKGLSFQVALVPDLPQQIPFLAEAETTGLRRNAVYIRKMASTEEASHDDLQALLNRRIETLYSTRPVLELEKRLDQLVLLYTQLEDCLVRHVSGRALRRSAWDGMVLIDGSFHKAGPLDEFLTEQIVALKARIEEILEDAS